MKKLITLLLILFTVNVIAQGFIGYTVFEPGDTVRWVYTTPKTIETDELEYNPIIKLYDIEKWIEHCYNDSTLVWIPYNCPMIGCLVNHPDVQEWQHKDPNNIIRFYNWLKENK